MATICCPKSVKGRVLRVTRNDECDVPLALGTARSRVEIAAFTMLKLSPDIQAGNDITVVNANGDICIQDKDKDRLKGFNCELTLCGVVFPVIEALVGVSRLMDVSVTDVIGGVLPGPNDSPDDSAQIEIWSKNAASGICIGANNLFVQWLLPKTRNWMLKGDVSFGNMPVEIVLGGYAQFNPNWTASIPSEWQADAEATIQAAGPLAWQCVGTVPTPVDCAYSDSGS